MREENDQSLSTVTGVVTEGVATMQSQANATRRDWARTLDLVSSTNYAVWDEHGLNNAAKTVEDFVATEKKLDDATVFNAVVMSTSMNNLS